MNIPSVRYADPSDRGGLLGPQRPANQAELSAGKCETGACDPFVGNCVGANGQQPKSRQYLKSLGHAFIRCLRGRCLCPAWSDSF